MGQEHIHRSPLDDVLDNKPEPKYVPAKSGKLPAAVDA